MVNNSHKQFKKFSITHILWYDNQHADSLAFLAPKIHSKMPRTIIVEIRDEPSCSPSLSVIMIIDVRKITTTDMINMRMEPLMDFLVRNKLYDSLLKHTTSGLRQNATLL